MEAGATVKRVILIAVGLSPLLFGYLTSYLTMSIWFYSLPRGTLTLISLAVLAWWFVAGFVCSKFFASKLEVILLLNAVAILVLVLALLQALVLRHLLIDMIQLFYLPLMRLASRLLSLFSLFVIDLKFVYLISFGFLISTSWLGVNLGKKWFIHR